MTEKGTVDPRMVRIDPKNSNYTVPRTWGLYRLDAGQKNVGRVFRYGNHPVRQKELEREFGAVTLIALYFDREQAREEALRRNKSH